MSNKEAYIIWHHNWVKPLDVLEKDELSNRNVALHLLKKIKKIKKIKN